MRCLVAIVCLVWSLTLPATTRAQDNENEGDVRPPVALRSYTGLSWGATHTIWNGRWSNEGYPQAGTMAPFISLRKISPVGSRMAMAPYLSYFAMYSTISTLICDTCTQGALNDDTRTERMYFREIDLGLNLLAYPSARNHNWYVGGGPVIRWGQAGKRVRGEERPGIVRKGAWFGLALVAGLRQDWGEKQAIFIEPQFTFSPDPSDRWQRNYPPETLTLHMGLLW